MPGQCVLRLTVRWARGGALALISDGTPRPTKISNVIATVYVVMVKEGLRGGGRDPTITVGLSYRLLGMPFPLLDFGGVLSCLVLSCVVFYVINVSSTPTKAYTYTYTLLHRNAESFENKQTTVFWACSRVYLFCRQPESGSRSPLLKPSLAIINKPKFYEVFYSLIPSWS